jgi:hypothetical protein
MASFLPQDGRENGRPRRQVRVANAPFAGRIDTNQEFAELSLEDSELLKRTPDAAPRVPWSQMLSPGQFLHLDLWNAAIIEGVGMQD